MEALDSFSTPKSRSDTLATFRDLLQTSLPIEQIHLRITREDDSDPCHVSPEEEADFQDIDTTELTALDEEQEQLEEVNDSSSMTDQADGIEQLTLDSEPDSSLNKPVRSYVDETLPDLLRGEKPLCRRVSSPMSNTLKQVCREVELSRRRSLRLKAQVDKLQEQSQDGLAWNQQKNRVTEEIQSIVQLLLPLTDLGQTADPVPQGSPLDTALLQLQNVARTLALNHTAHRQSRDGKTDNDGTILQQALRDRDDALAKKKAMESELLKSKTELMTLNNQLLEAVQRRLEMAIELEAWKDDVQAILHHQLQNQQQAEQAQKKAKGFSVLRRSKQASPAQPPAPSRAPTSISQSPNTPVAQRWKERLRRGRISQQTSSSVEQPANNSSFEPDSPSSFSKEDRFQIVSLD
ncbi:bicaudal-D-related protein 2-like [Colossoma macropomum]|uniref:bicaudal-D-related protein 2-like n=1 Tax=Colossoma macropomum TaxID=42526 RepID=UPI0018653BF6|nr:bicaudal-D-related protein 2-like [Colossoma macropomum]